MRRTSLKRTCILLALPLLALLMSLWWPPREVEQGPTCDVSAADAALTAYVAADSAELAARIRADAKYENFANDLAGCTDDRARLLHLYYRAVATRLAGEDSVRALAAALGYLDQATAGLATVPAYLHNERGIVYELLDSPEEAERAYRAAIGADSTFALAYSNLANVQLATNDGRADTAMANYRKAKRKAGGNLAPASLGLGIALAENDPAAALTELEAADLAGLDERPFARARALYLAGDTLGAVAIYRDLAARPGRNRRVKLAMVYHYVAVEQFDSALLELELDTLLKGKNPRLRGRAYPELLTIFQVGSGGAGGERRRAKRLLRRDLRKGIAPSEIYGYANLVNLIDRNELRDSLDAFTTRLGSKRRRGARAYQRVAVVLYQNGKLQRAVRVARWGRNKYADVVLAHWTFIEAKRLQAQAGGGGNYQNVVQAIHRAESDLGPGKFRRLYRQFICTNSVYESIIPPADLNKWPSCS